MLKQNQLIQNVGLQAETELKIQELVKNILYSALMGDKELLFCCTFSFKLENIIQPKPNPFPIKAKPNLVEQQHLQWMLISTVHHNHEYLD